MKIGVVGATGLVGREMIRVLEEIDLGEETFIPVASERSAGQKVSYKGREHTVITLDEALEQDPQIVIFSAGASVSREWAPKFADRGAFVIDNSSAWRKEQGIPLVVPEINAAVIRPEDRIISNPNCSTIQLVMVLAPLHRKFGIRRVVVATYQSVTGSGAKGMLQLENERKGIAGPLFYPHTVDLNLIPQAGDFTGNGYTTEEEKLAFETCKIIGDDNIRVTATAVRVPVYGGHSEAVNIELERPFEVSEVRELLSGERGIVVQDDPAAGIYPMPKFTRGSNDVFVGRIRRDNTIANGLNLWIVADNLRKGAATNAIQIAQYLIQSGLIR
ncbi:MAG: aspartate-semialdehyde dehydrogenase [Bacteroidales bacterium]|nr:aspartate-semialdehyde dehydrogenase [Bacteroidales bacterium]